jgi:hypothetical protein
VHPASSIPRFALRRSECVGQLHALRDASPQEVTRVRGENLFMKISTCRAAGLCVVGFRFSRFGSLICKIVLRRGRGVSCTDPSWHGSRPRVEAMTPAGRSPLTSLRRIPTWHGRDAQGPGACQGHEEGSETVRRSQALAAVIATHQANWGGRGPGVV